MSHHTGELLGGRYRLDNRIASGGMGEVWQATDRVLGRAVAVKTLHADRILDPQMARRFRHEALAMAALHHPGVVDVYDFGQDPGTDAYLVMARVSGQPLNQRIAERGRLAPAETMAIVAEAGRALQAAHEAGIVHRDVKPSNILIRPDGSAVLVDFGVASSARSAARTDADQVVGTASYIAPEQVAKRPVGPAADVYSLGAVAYHCLSGHPPFFGDNPVTVALRHLKDTPPPLPQDVPPAVRAVVTTALAKSPTARFPSAAAMADAAERAARTVALRNSHAAPGTQVPDRRTRRRHLLAGALLTVLVLLGAGAALALADRSEWLPEPPAPATSVPATPSVTRPTTRPTAPADGGAAGGPSSTPTGTPTLSPTPTSRTPDPSPTTTQPSPTTTPPGTTPTGTSPTQTPTSQPPTTPDRTGTATGAVPGAAQPR